MNPQDERDAPTVSVAERLQELEVISQVDADTALAEIRGIVRGRAESAGILASAVDIDAEAESIWASFNARDALPGHIDPLLAAGEAVTALMTVIGGDSEKPTDRGQLTRLYQGSRHLRGCEIGMFLTRGSAATGGDPCNPRCQAAHRALALGAAFLALLIAECVAQPGPTEQLRLLEAAS